MNISQRKGELSFSSLILFPSPSLSVSIFGGDLLIQRPKAIVSSFREKQSRIQVLIKPLFEGVFDWFLRSDMRYSSCSGTSSFRLPSCISAKCHSSSGRLSDRRDEQQQPDFVERINIR